MKSAQRSVSTMVKGTGIISYGTHFKKQLIFNLMTRTVRWEITGFLKYTVLCGREIMLFKSGPHEAELVSDE